MNLTDTSANSRCSDEDPIASARKLREQVEKVVELFPDVDRDNVRHTLILLDLPPLERLQRSLLRARASTIRR